MKEKTVNLLTNEADWQSLEQYIEFTDNSIDGLRSQKIKYSMGISKLLKCAYFTEQNVETKMKSKNYCLERKGPKRQIKL